MNDSNPRDKSSSHIRRWNADMSNEVTKDKIESEEQEREIAQIRDALRGLRFGAVTIVVQDGVVVQIDRTEKRRLTGRHKSPGA
jgi:hypothetical protein